MDARELIAKLGLVPHPLEGGCFRETYRSDEILPATSLPERYVADRALSTAIYYLLTPDAFSAMHRLKSDEVFHFYLGDPVEMLQLHADGSHSVILIGGDIDAGQSPQVVVPKGTWQGCRLSRSVGPCARSDAREGLRYGFALLGTTVAPAFDPDDYEDGDRAELMALYPQCKRMIGRLTRR